jgi:hypothetical protein
LRGLGWQLLRVWSTDWWHDPAAALNRLHDAIMELLAADRSRIVAIQARLFPPEESNDALSDQGPETGSADQPAVADTPAPPEKPAGSRGPDYRFATLDHLAGEIDPDQFYESSYELVLARVVGAVIEQEAPILGDMLIDRVARAYGFQRSGPLIRDAVLGVCRRHFHLADDPAGGRFAWPNAEARASWSTYRLPADGDSIRLIDAICIEELRALAMEVDGPDVPVEVARRLGIRRLTAGARLRIERAIQPSDGA